MSRARNSKPASAPHSPAWSRSWNKGKSAGTARPPGNPTLTIVRDGAFDQAITEAPNSPAVFLVWPAAGAPYLTKTAALRKRLLRLLKEREKPSRLLSLRETVSRVECWITGSALESALRLYQLARIHFPKTRSEEHTSELQS